MQRSFKPILRLSWRYTKRRPLQSLFLVLGVAIGVSMIVAIDLANGSAQRAFELGTDAVAGRTTHQILGGPSGLEQEIYIQLRRQLGYRLSAPVVEEYVTTLELDSQPMRLLGVDPFAEGPFRSYLGSGNTSGRLTIGFLGKLMAQSHTVLLSSAVAERYDLESGDEITIRVRGTKVALEIVSLLVPSDDLSRRALEGLLIVDISTAQEILGRVRRLDRIDLIVPEADESVLADIGAILPPGARIEQAAARAGTVDEMTRAFRLNLTALSLLALVVGMFLIYNTVTFNVIQRRPVLGSLRSLGMTQNEIFTLILTETGLLGLIGTAVGLGFGILLGIGAVQLVTQTINDLFFVVAVREIDISPWTLLKGILFGMGAALLGAAIPAYEATSIPPTGALRRSNVEEKTMKLLPWITLSGIFLLALGAILLIPEWHLTVAFAGLFMLILGCALLTPILTWGLMKGITWLGAGSLISRMAPRYIIRALSRTSVAVAALMVAVSVIVGVGVMIGSFRLTVVYWLDDILQADIFMTTPSLNSNQLGSVNHLVLEHLQNQDWIDRLFTSHSVRVAGFLESDDSNSSKDASPSAAGNKVVELRLFSISEDMVGENRRYHQAIGDWQETWQAIEAGGIVINEPMMRRTGLEVGDEVAIQTDRGVHTFPIVGVAVSFDVNFVVLIHDSIYREFWDDQRISGIALFVAPEIDVDQQVDELRSIFAGEAELLIQSNRGMRQNALEVFDRTFSITLALQLLATLVAFIGILSTLMSLQMERVREIGVLRANGMTRQQLWRLSLFETGLIGSCAGLIAMPTGFLLALVLIYIINLRSFGWTLEMQLQPTQFVQAFGVALIAALLAGLYPAWHLGKIQPANAVRSE